jgi:hypothetical protein
MRLCKRPPTRANPFLEKIRNRFTNITNAPQCRGLRCHGMPCLDQPHHSGVFLYLLNLIGLNDDDLGAVRPAGKLHYANRAASDGLRTRIR